MIFRTDSVDDLIKKYPKINRDIISEIFLCGYNNHKAVVTDIILDLFKELKEDDVEIYKDRIFRLYMKYGVDIK